MDRGGFGMRLRPLGIGDVLDETFRLWRRHFLAFVVTMAVVVAPAALLGILIQLVVGVNPNFGNFDRMSQETLLGLGIVAVVAAVIFGIVAGIVYLFATIAVVHLASNAVLGQPVDVREAYRYATGRSGAVVLTSLLIGLAVGLLVVTCIGIPVAVWLGLGWSVAMPAIVIERLGAIDGMRRSWDLVRGHRWRLLVVFVLMGLISYILVSLPGALATFVVLPAMLFASDNPALLALANAFNTLMSAVGQALFGSLGLIVGTLVYYDLLVRNEAFDLRQRTRALPATEAPAGGDSPYGGSYGTPYGGAYESPPESTPSYVSAPTDRADIHEPDVRATDEPGPPGTSRPLSPPER